MTFFAIIKISTMLIMFMTLMVMAQKEIKKAFEHL